MNFDKERAELIAAGAKDYFSIYYAEYNHRDAATGFRPADGEYRIYMAPLGKQFVGPSIQQVVDSAIKDLKAHCK